MEKEHNHNHQRKNTYKPLKEYLNLEHYFNINPGKLWTAFIKYSTAKYYLPVKTGRWNNVLLEDRLCSYCNTNGMGD